MGSPLPIPDHLTNAYNWTRSWSERARGIGKGALQAVVRSQRTKRLKEIEASEACRWLRAAGFPQYAQMYTDQLYPLDASSVQKDHRFLDNDSLQSLYKRINTLNKCATMKIDTPSHKHQDDSDDEEEFALSDKWRYQSSTSRWVRCDAVDTDEGRTTLQSCSSHDSVITDNEESHPDTLDGSLIKSRDGRESASGSDSHSLLLSPALRRAASERIKSAKNLLKKMESLRRPRKSSSSLRSSSRERSKPFLEISQPTAVSTDSLEERIEVLGCVDISPSPSNQSNLNSPLIKRTMSSPTETAGEPTTNASSTSHLTNNAFLKPNSSPASHRRNHSSSDLDEAVYLLDPDYKPGSFPKVIANGYIDVGNGSQVNYRTGSFNMGAESGTYKDNLKKRINRRVTDLNDNSDVVQRTAYDSSRSSKKENRLSIYDNMPSSGNKTPEVEPKKTSENSSAQKELDLILHDLYQNISDLNQSLTKEVSVPVKCSETKTGTPSPDIRHGSASSAGADDHFTFPPSAVRHCVTNTASSTATSTPTTSAISPALHSPVAQPGIDTHSPQSPKTPPAAVATASTVLVDGSINSNVSATNCSPSSGQGSGSCTGDEERAIAMAVDDSLLLMDRSSVSTTSSCHELSDEDDDGVAGAGSRGSDGSQASLGSRDDEECIDGATSADTSRERRDSGVGSSLTRAPSDRRRHRIRWHSFVKSHRPSLNSRNLQISNMSAGQLMVMHKLSLLKVTAVMEKYSPSIRSGWNWIMPKFIKRFKSPDYKDKHVFGVPLHIILQRTGQPLPQCILYAMRCLRRNARDAVGIFRKSGVRSRIQKLRNQIEANPDSTDFENLQSYDVADLLKQYFRELPESLLTSKLSETFISIFTHVPSDMRLESLQAAVLLLPDENRQVLQSLLLFLSDMAEHSSENQMTASNLAVCFAPSLFHMCGVGPTGSGAASVASPKRSRKQMAAAVPDQRELMEQKSAHQCLTAMICHCKQLFTVPEEMLSKCRLSYIAQGDPVPITELGSKRSEDESSSDYTSYMECCVQGLLKESQEKFKGWAVVGTEQGIEVAYKKVRDGHPLRLWKCCMEVEAPPVEVLNRVMRERHLWDDDLLKWRVVERLDNDTEVFQHVLNSMAPHPTTDFVEIRSWRTELAKGSCVLVSTSVEHPEAPLMGGIQGVTLASRYLIEPCGSGKSRVTHICRVDLRGHTPDWYNKSYSHLCVNNMTRMRNSFKQSLETSEGPETKV